MGAIVKACCILSHTQANRASVFALQKRRLGDSRVCALSLSKEGRTFARATRNFLILTARGRSEIHNLFRVTSLLSIFCAFFSRFRHSLNLKKMNMAVKID